MKTVSVVLLDYRFSLRKMVQRFSAAKMALAPHRHLKRERGECLEAAYYDLLYRKTAVSVLRSSAGFGRYAWLMVPCIATIALTVWLLVDNRLRPLNCTVILLTGVNNLLTLVGLAKRLYAELVSMDREGVTAVVRAYERRQLRASGRAFWRTKPFLRPNYQFSYSCNLSNDSAI